MSKAKSAKTNRNSRQPKHAKWMANFNAGKGLKHRKAKRRLARLAKRLAQRKKEHEERQRGMVAMD